MIGQVSEQALVGRINRALGRQVEAARFPGRLRELRQAAGLTQKQLAEKAGVSQRAVSHWEQGLREPSWGNVIALGRVLGVDCTAFLLEPASDEKPGRGRPPKEGKSDVGKQTGLSGTA
jgi:transcriptional regulator with XRE-family HTH domain